MPVYSREVLSATRFLCTSGGSAAAAQLQQRLQELHNTTEEEFTFIMNQCPRFLLVRGPQEDLTVLARTRVRLCARYFREECCESESESESGSGSGSGSCEQLHLCRFFIYGTCRFGKGRKPCKFSHDIRSDHNYRLLRDFHLHELNEDELFVLLLQNDATLLPEVCVHYNRGSGCHGDCSFQESCTKVHLCQHFVQGDCLFGSKCHRQHAVNQHGCRKLEERGLSRDIVQELPFIYRNLHHLTAAADDHDDRPESRPDNRQMDDKPNICLHFLRNSCKFQNGCRSVHYHLPYRWEVLDGDTWTDLQHMEDIERDFCDPSKTQSCGNRPVDFMTMTQDFKTVHRLSTVSSVTKPPHYTLTTQWRWFYKGDQGNWIEYGELDEKQRSTSVTSTTLEETFLSDPKAEVKVLKGQRQYVLSFKDMYVRNPKHNTKRRVRRRPRFISVAEVERQVTQ
ncbi:protein mono-ADP-ribosyltransferase PARP12b [Symphorus nematophorus]